MNNFISRKKTMLFLCLFLGHTKTLLFTQSLSRIANMKQEERYEYALEDAQTPTPYRINKDLVPVIPTNHTIIWNKNQTKVLVTSLRELWTYKFLPKNINDKNSGITVQVNNDDTQAITSITPTGPENNNFYTIYRNYSVDWVTIAPKLLNFGFSWIKHKNKPSIKEITTRLNERLGLPPEHNDKKKFIVELWVSPEDLIRPSVDPEVFDTTAIPENLGESSYYKKISHFISSNILENSQLSQDQKDKFAEEEPWKNITTNRYLNWFENEQKNNKFPWTQLGYTYDYSSEAFNKTKSTRNFGESEFIIKPGSKVEIAGIYSLDEYFSQDHYKKKQQEIEQNAQKNIDEFKSIIEDTQSSMAKKIHALEAIQNITEQVYSSYPNIILETDKGFFKKAQNIIIKTVLEKIDSKTTINNTIEELLNKAKTMKNNGNAPGLIKNTLLEEKKKLDTLISQFNTIYINNKIEPSNHKNLEELNNFFKIIY